MYKHIFKRGYNFESKRGYMGGVSGRKGENAVIIFKFQDQNTFNKDITLDKNERSLFSPSP